MKVYILQEKLKKGIETMERISPRSLTLPALNNILMKTDGNFLALSATDLEIGINWWGLAKTEKEGDVALPLYLFSGFFNLLPNKQITIQKVDEAGASSSPSVGARVSDSLVAVECGNYKTQMKGFPSDDFPIIPQVPKGEFVEIEAALFCQGLEQIVNIASFSQARPEISGVYFTLQKNTIKMAATDSFRLGEKTIFLGREAVSAEVGDKEISLILPQKTAKEVINIYGQRQGKLKIYFSQNQILFENQMSETAHPEVQLVSRLIDGEYPNYQEIIPKKYTTQAILNKGEFLNQLKIAALFGGKINEVKLKINPQKSAVEILSQAPDLGEHYSFLQGDIKGEALEISFNHRFLIAGLSMIKSPEVIFELNKEEGPALLRPADDSSYIYVVMPIKAS